MPRVRRQDIVTAGGVYHLIVRGNNKAAVFRDDDDYRYYSSLIMSAKRYRGVSLFHFVLMPNHVHMLVAAGENGLSEFMHEIQLPYAKRYCRKYQHVGHVWQGRYKSLPVETDAYLFACGNYIELNPVRAGLVKKPEEWPYASYTVYAAGILSPIIDLDPVYPTLGRDPEERQSNYRKLLSQSIEPVPKVPGTR